MSQFSEVLSAYVKERDVNTYMLAKYCGYDRANMYKVLNGKRKVPNIGFVRKMAGYMHLSAREEERLLEEYCISVVGYENYYRRKSIQDFFENFSWREDSAVAFSTMKVAPDWNLPEEQTVAIIGTYEVEAAIFKIVAEETADPDGHLHIILQPEAEFLNRILGLCGHSDNQIRVDHIVRLSNRPEDLEEKTLYNLECIRKVLPLYNYSYDYVTWYYYGNCYPEDMLFAAFPYLILSNRYACLLSTDMKRGCLTRNHEVLALMKEFFEEHRNRCRRLISCQKNLEEQMLDLKSVMKSKYSGYCFNMPPCFMYTLTRPLIEKYLVTDIPDRDCLIEKVVSYCHTLSTQKLTYILSMEGVLQFLNTGIIPEFSRDLYRPVEWEDRIDMIRKQLHPEKGSTVKVLKQPIGSLENYVSMVVTPEHGTLRFNVPARNLFLNLMLEESGILNSFYDFCENLENDLFYTLDEAEKLLDQAIRKQKQ
ncbi:hypothetical protein AAA088_10345 [Hominifimenecus microfluidus]|uniref:hypothetical protein n=1 Tax=Hominifimenecus microfluidus TaxID=2885348 RepID=UPI0032C1886B